MKNKFQGCILGLAIGDALGYPVEFCRSRDDILRATNGKGVIGLPDPALFTDDTQMSLCISQALIKSNGHNGKFMKYLSKYFIKWLEKQQEGSPDRRAPGSSCLAGCENLKGGSTWEYSGIDSKGCGSAMRSAPIGLYFSSNLLNVIEWARDSSFPTHTNPTAIAASAATALMTFLAINDVPVGLWAHELRGPLGGISAMPGLHDPSSMPGSVNFIKDELMDVIIKASEAAGNREDPWSVLHKDGLGEGWLGHEAVASALYCSMMNPSDYKKAVLMAANTVGDSDSIACITGAIMGAKVGIEGIPEEWIEKIEAKDSLLKMADELFETKK